MKSRGRAGAGPVRAIPALAVLRSLRVRGGPATNLDFLSLLALPHTQHGFIQGRMALRAVLPRTFSLLPRFAQNASISWCWDAPRAKKRKVGESAEENVVTNDFTMNAPELSPPPSPVLIDACCARARTASCNRTARG